MDGFIFRLNSRTGDLDTTSTVATRRIGTAGHDYIISQCSPAEEMTLMEEDKFQNTDETLSNILYIVGATSSTMYLPTRTYAQGDGIIPIYRVFISKIDLDTLEQVWTTEMFAPAGSTGANATATKCVVDPATKDVYVSGMSTTQLQAHVPSGQSGIRGNDDGATGGLWVTRMDDNGMIKWLKQFGSGNTGGDADRITDLTLVPASGLSPTATSNDAARVLVSGHTNGNVASSATTSNTELFVAALDAATGDLLSALPPTPPPTQPPTDPPTDPPVPVPTDLPVPAPTEAPVPAPTVAPEPTDAPILSTPPPEIAQTDAPKHTDPSILPTEDPIVSPTDDGETEEPTDSPTWSPTSEPDPHSDASIARDGVGFQSNWGPSYAGAMVYDFTRRK
jgi:hypothetical protein